MAILNYTTEIKAGKTVGEISDILGANKARKITVDNDEDGNPIGITFCIIHKEEMIAFTLPCNWKGVLKAMEKDGNVTRKYCNKEQAIRVAWRIIKDWICAQMAIIQAEQASMVEVFLPYAITRDGKTVHEMLSNDPTLFLTM
jgi:hypothetical protein